MYLSVGWPLAHPALQRNTHFYWDGLEINRKKLGPVSLEQPGYHEACPVPRSCSFLGHKMGYGHSDLFLRHASIIQPGTGKLLNKLSMQK